MAPIEIVEAGQREGTTMQHFIFAILNIHVTLRTQKKFLILMVKFGRNH